MFVPRPDLVVAPIMATSDSHSGSERIGSHWPITGLPSSSSTFSMTNADSVPDFGSSVLVVRAR